MIRTSARVLATLAVGVLAVACGRGNSDSLSLTSPAFGAGSTTNSLTGTVNGLSGSCPTVTFTLERQAVTTDASTSFGESPCAALKNLVRVEIAGTVQADGRLLATRVRIIPSAPPPAPPASPTTVSVAGTVTSLSGSCPTINFKLETRVVVTDANTSFGDNKCAEVKNGQRVEIAGTVQGDSRILASTLHIVPPTTNPPPSPTPVPTTVSVSGSVAALGGTCPVLSFKIEQRVIRTDVATSFGDGTCADVKNDVRVELAGTVQADGSILAIKVRVVPPVAPPPPPPPTPGPSMTISGVISAVSGTCPKLVLAVGARRAITTATTKFDGVSCDALKEGVAVDITGAIATATDTFVADKVALHR